MIKNNFFGGCYRILKEDNLIKNNLRLDKNKFLIFVTVFIALAVIFSFGLNNVSAANPGDIIYVNSSGGNDVNDGSSWLSAKQSISNATGSVNINGTVNIADGQYTGSNNTGITIDKSMTIIGESQTNTIINGQQSGKSIFTILSTVDVTIINLTFTNNNAIYDGGAIYNSGTLTSTNNTFTTNTAIYDGGAIYNSGTLTSTNNTFTTNTAPYCGGAIYNCGTLTETNDTFNNNTATSGGAMCNVGTLTSTNNTFNNNNAAYDVGGGGAIYNCGTLTETNDIFNNNTAHIGGAIYNYSGTLTSTNDTFNNNTAHDGGAIYNGCPLTSTNDTFNNNTAYDGGAIYNFSGTLTSTNDTYNNNTVKSVGGGAIYNYSGTLTLTNNTYNNNTAYNGGAIYNGDTLTSTNNTFNNNTAQQGTIYNDGTLTETNDTFNNNTATYAGGAILNVGTLTSTNNTYNNNTAQWGTIYNGGTLTSTNDTFNNNSALYGGAIYNGKGILTSTYNTFNNNTATNYGGAIYNYSGTLTSTNDTFNNNTAIFYGGAIYNFSGTLTSTNDTYNNISYQEITNPLNGTYVHDVVPINVTSNEIIGITKVVFTINSNNYTDTDGTDGWSYNWNTTGLTDGIYNITVIAYDAANNCQIQTIYVNIENTIPTVTATPTGGIYNNTQTVTLKATNTDGIAAIFYTTDGSTPTNSSTIYNVPIIVSKNTTIKYIAINHTGKLSSVYTFTYTIDKIVPTAIANIKGGLYNTTKIVSLSISEPGTIYYTLNGTTPTTTSSKYTGPITISSTKILKFLAIDLAGNKSPIYTNTYTIDKVAPKIPSTSPTNLKTGISRTITISIKFSENIKNSTYYNSITIKNLTTGKYLTLTKTFSGNTMYIKTGTRTANTWYQVIIPKAAMKDLAGNNLPAIASFKFKTGT